MHVVNVSIHIKPVVTCRQFQGRMSYNPVGYPYILPPWDFHKERHSSRQIDVRANLDLQPMTIFHVHVNQLETIVYVENSIIVHIKAIFIWNSTFLRYYILEPQLIIIDSTYQSTVKDNIYIPIWIVRNRHDHR